MKKREIGQVFADNLRAEMTKAGMKQPQLAKRSGYSQSVISQVLKGQVSPSIDKLAKLAHALGIQPWELLVDLEATREAALRKMLGGEKS